jgi:hypothetical protein
MRKDDKELTPNLRRHIFLISKPMVQATRAPAQMTVFEYMQATAAGLCCGANGPTLSHRVIGFQRTVSISSIQSKSQCLGHAGQFKPARLCGRRRYVAKQIGRP